jgi:hypothetical protein
VPQNWLVLLSGVMFVRLALRKRWGASRSVQA